MQIIAGVIFEQHNKTLNNKHLNFIANRGCHFGSLILGSIQEGFEPSTKFLMVFK